MARSVRQVLPQPPPVYDQAYIAQLANAVNRYMIQAQALGELITGRVIITDPPIVANTPTPPAGQFANTTLLPTGTLYLIDPTIAPAGIRYVAIVNKGNP